MVKGKATARQRQGNGKVKGKATARSRARSRATAKAKRGPSAKSGLQDDDPDRIVSVPPFLGNGKATAPSSQQQQ
jgi:hypothetical protein